MEKEGWVCHTVSARQTRYTVEKEGWGVSHSVCAKYYGIDSQLLVLSYRFCRSGNLMTRSLNDVVTGDDVVSGSEYLQTLLVVVPKSLYREWEKSYETIAEMIVPRSSR